MPRRFFQTESDVALSILASHGPSVFAVYSILLLHMDLKTRRCRPSQPTICTEANVSASTAKRAMALLEMGEYIARTGGVGRGHVTEYCIKGFTDTAFMAPFDEEKGSQKSPPEPLLDAEKGSQKGSSQGLKGFIGTPFLNINGQEYGQEKREDTHATPPLVYRRPTREQCREYCHAIGLSEEEADKFFDAYETRGWVTFGKYPVPVQDYQAAARKWASNVPRFLESNGTKPSGGHTLQSMRSEIGDHLVAQGIFDGD